MLRRLVRMVRRRGSTAKQIRVSIPNDAQYRSWIPVDDVDSADRLNELSPFELLPYGGIKEAFPSSAEKPAAPHWNMGADKL
jgi:hypothetical protein